jgi:hypothetical protein
MPKGVHNGHRRGSAHPRWNHGRILSEEGYVKLRVGVGHPCADANGYAYEHDMVMVAAIGRHLEPDEVVHHRNDDKLDNRIENLELHTRAAHNALHLADRERGADGRLLPRRAA